jgi:hypothetical protein
LHILARSTHVGRESFEYFGRNGGVALHEWSEHTARGLYTNRERSYIEEEQVLGLLRDVAAEDGSLDGSTVRDSLVRVDALTGHLAVEKIGHELNDERDAGRAADEDDIVDVDLVYLGVA